MAGLVPAIYVFLAANAVKTWMPGTSPGMTEYHHPGATSDAIGTSST
jgi:hypothetical protein